MFARLSLATVALLIQAIFQPIVVYAHQPVVLTTTDTTAAKGPLLTDGTVSFAVRASFSKTGERRAFRAAFKSGDQLSVQYLIVDKKPENSLRTTALPSVLITAPSGKQFTLKISERTKFFEPFSKTNYLYLSRFSSQAEAGIYSILITSRGKAEVTVAIGDREVAGEVVRGALSNPTPSATPSANPKSTPSPTASSRANIYTFEMVRQNNSEKSCWTLIDGYVYDLTRWITSHPGGAGAIRSLCGVDGTAAFKAQHLNQYKPEQRLEGFLLGPLNRS